MQFVECGVASCPKEVITAFTDRNQDAFCDTDATCLSECTSSAMIGAHCACNTGALFASCSFDFTGETYCCGDVSCQNAIVTFYEV